jgi:hypothetical protein
MPASELPYYASLTALLQDHPLLTDDSKFSGEELEILHAIASGRSAQHCNELLSLATKRFGVDAFAAGEVDLKQRDRVVFYSMQWSESWRQYYLTNFLQRDPMLRLMEEADEPFTWGEWKAGKRLTGEEPRSSE